MLEHLWAGWRIPYIQADDGGVDVPEGKTLFEAIFNSGLPDDETFILHRGEHCFAMLNAYPYTSGHVMVLSKRGVADFAALSDEEYNELWLMTRAATAAITAAYQPSGLNIGVNLGRGAGAGVPDHLHVHIVPRWDGDTNFMTAVANTRVMPEALVDSWRRISEAWT